MVAIEELRKLVPIMLVKNDKFSGKVALLRYTKIVIYRTQSLTDSFKSKSYRGPGTTMLVRNYRDKREKRRRI